MYTLILIFFTGSEVCMQVVPGQYTSKEKARAAGQVWIESGSFRVYTVIPAPEQTP